MDAARIEPSTNGEPGGLPGPFTRLLHDSGLLDLVRRASDEHASPAPPAGPYTHLLRSSGLLQHLEQLEQFRQHRDPDGDIEKGKGKDDGKGTRFNRHRGELRREKDVHYGPRGGRYADAGHTISLPRRTGAEAERSEEDPKSATQPQASHETTTEPPQRPTSWKLGAHKSMTTWRNQMAKRGWTLKQIAEAIREGEQAPMPNNVNNDHTASRYAHPETGRWVIIDDVTKEVLHVSEDRFKYQAH